MLKHPDECTKDQLDVRIVILSILCLLAIQVCLLSEHASVVHAIPIAVTLYGLGALGRARLRWRTRGRLSSTMGLPRVKHTS